MSEYIKRADVKEMLSNARKNLKLRHYGEKDFFARDNVLLNAELKIQAIPPADVVERKRGEWVEDYNIINDTYHFHCSVCGDEEWGTRKQMEDTHFCPNCGAEMRELDDGN